MSTTINFIACFVLLWICRESEEFIKIKDSTADLFYGPTSQTIHWSPLFPPAIPCNKRPIPEQNRILSKKLTGTKLAHITNSTAHGYLCTKAIWTVTYSEGFFRTLTHKIHPSLPSLNECQDAVRLYKTNHHSGVGFPVKRCGWMGVETESSVNISKAFVHVDPYSQKFIDSRFIGGSCGDPPCKLITLDTLWMNTSSVNKMCQQRTAIDLFVQNMNGSDDLVATTIRGACYLKMCGENGIRLVTGEWINLPAKTSAEVNWIKDIDNFPTLAEIQDVSLKGIMSHMEGQLLLDESYRLCIESKEKFLTGEPTTRFDIARIAPTIPLGGPVFRKNGDRIEVGFSEYTLLKSPENALVGSNPDVIGYNTVSHKPIIWKYWTNTNSTVREGPNGITSVGRYLINPLVSLTSPGLYRHILDRDHPNLYEGPMGHTLDIEFDPKHSPKELTKVIKHWWGTWSFTRWFWILLSTIILLTVLSFIVR